MTKLKAWVRIRMNKEYLHMAGASLKTAEKQFSNQSFKLISFNILQQTL